MSNLLGPISCYVIFRFYSNSQSLLSSVGRTMRAPKSPSARWRDVCEWYQCVPSGSGLNLKYVIISKIKYPGGNIFFFKRGPLITNSTSIYQSSIIISNMLILALSLWYPSGLLPVLATGKKRGRQNYYCMGSFYGILLV